MDLVIFDIEKFNSTASTDTRRYKTFPLQHSVFYRTLFGEIRLNTDRAKNLFQNSSSLLLKLYTFYLTRAEPSSFAVSQFRSCVVKILACACCVTTVIYLACVRCSLHFKGGFLKQKITQSLWFKYFIVSSVLGVLKNSVCV